MTFEPSASQAQIDARQHVFDNQPDPATLVSREEIRAALLDRHTAATQDKLDAAHVAICGCGGLGSTIAVALTRIGVGHLHLIDFDRVDMTNLNRQQYFLKDLGQYKTEALRSNLRQINPFTDITIDTVKVTDENVPTLLRKRGHHRRGVRRAGKQDDARQRGAGESGRARSSSARPAWPASAAPTW